MPDLLERGSRGALGPRKLAQGGKAGHRLWTGSGGDAAAPRLRTSAMSLEMRPACERCDVPLHLEGPAFICSYECTYCEECNATLGQTCPNCGGELLKRPRRLPRDR